MSSLCLVINIFPSQRLLHSQSHCTAGAINSGREIGIGIGTACSEQDTQRDWVAGGIRHVAGSLVAFAVLVIRDYITLCDFGPRTRVSCLLSAVCARLLRPCGLHLSWSCAFASAPGFVPKRKDTRPSSRVLQPHLWSPGNALCAFLTFIDCNHKSNVLYNEIC